MKKTLDNSTGMFKLTDLRTYSASWTLPKLLILRSTDDRFRLQNPRIPLNLTVLSQWAIYPTRLSDVCRRLRIPLRHHDSGADAKACARIVLAAEAEGWRRRS